MLLERPEGIPGTRKERRKIGVLLISSPSMWEKKKHAWEVESLGHWSPGAQESLMSVVKQQEQGSRTMSSGLGGKQIWMGSQQDVWTS